MLRSVNVGQLFLVLPEAEAALQLLTLKESPHTDYQLTAHSFDRLGFIADPVNDNQFMYVHAPLDTTKH